MEFYLGTHKPAWLARVSFPLFISDRTLKTRKRLPRALGPWALDSGAFSELSQYGAWRDPRAVRNYGERIRRYAGEIGRLEWAAPQDWMSEPFIREKTGLAVGEHLSRTVENYLELRSLSLPVAVIPVIQGYELGDYLACMQLYATRGVDLASLPRVGLGSICRRQGTRAAETIVAAIREAAPGIRLHAFGVKTQGLERYRKAIASSDSLAWSFHARRRPPLPECSGHKNCANCLRYATAWRERLLDTLGGV